MRDDADTVPGPALTSAEHNGAADYLKIKLAIGLQCLAWSFQLPYVPLYLQDELHASKVTIAAIMAMQVGIQVVVTPSALSYGQNNGKALELTIAAWVISAIGVGLLALSRTVGGATFSFAVWSVGGMLVCPLNDSAALLQLGERKSEYGKQRLWGAVTWGLGNAAAGKLIQSVGFRTTSIVAVLLHLVAGGFAASLRSHVQTQELLAGGRAKDGARTLVRTSALADADNKSHVWPAFTTPAAMLFILTVMVCSSYFAAIQSYLFLWLADLGAAPDIMGLSLTFTCITEPIFFFFAPKMIKELGVEWMMKLTIGSYAIRCLAYSVLSPRHATWVLPVELLHGVTFGVFISAVVHQTSELAQRGQRRRHKG